MRHSIFFLLAVLIVFSVSSPQVSARVPNTVHFDDSNPTVMVLGNGAYYEIGLRKSNGSIAYIRDKTTGQQVSAGSRNECLWGLSSQNANPPYVGGCSYNVAWANQFTYSWSNSTRTLTLNYVPDPAATQRVVAQVDLTGTDEPWFDLHLSLQNNWGYVMEYALFPSDLVFLEADVQEAILPVLPGIILQPAFFQQSRNYSYTVKYPGYPGLFADYVSIRSSKGQIAMYSLYDQEAIRPLVLGFVDDQDHDGQTFFYHTFGAHIADGAAWNSPWVRVRVSQSAPATIAAFRTDNGLDKYRSLAEKLDSRYTQVVQSPLYKADVCGLNIPFSQYPALLSKLPSPGILHPVAYQPGCHDESYPDFMPPALAWGTTADMAAMFQEAHARGLLVMPFTNPTWWDDQSPTLQNLSPPTIGDLAALDDQGNPLHENYDTHGGYVMSPYPVFVQQRLATLIGQMTTSVPSDLVFEDQIGARPWLFDHNASSPAPVEYMNGWLAHTRTYAGSLLMTELGYDRLLETEVGFHGSILLPERFGYTPGWLGTGTWRPYPFATMLARDKVLFYQHDLAPETTTVDKATLAWNLALGYMLTYDITTAGTNHPWLPWVGALQKYILSSYASENIISFNDLSSQVTQTIFPSVTVTANWDAAQSYSTAGYTLPPQGALVRNNSGLFIAGVFTAYNGMPLSAGDHYLIEERAGNAITVRQPMGADTALTVHMLPGWTTNQPIGASAYNAAGQAVESVPLTVTSQGITFTYRGQDAGQAVSYYQIVKTAAPPVLDFLPLISK